MDACDLLNSDEAELPKTRNEDDFITYLEDTFQGYLKLISKLQSGDYVTQQIRNNKEEVSNLCNKILGAVKHSERGMNRH